MMFLILASAAVATLAATPIHSAEISYAFSSYPASEETESTVRFHDVERRFATRYSRALSGKSAAVAQQDRAFLLRERDGVQALSVKGR